MCWLFRNRWDRMGVIIEWCQRQDLYAALQWHNDPSDPYCLPLFSAFVLGLDIKQERQLIHINFSNGWFLLNAIRTIKTGWAVQLNGDATFGFCDADIDMMALDFCSFGRAHYPCPCPLFPRKTTLPPLDFKSHRLVPPIRQSVLGRTYGTYLHYERSLSIIFF